MWKQDVGHIFTTKTSPSLCMLSILVDPKESNLMELRQLGNQHEHQGTKVDGKVDGVVLSVEAREEE